MSLDLSIMYVSCYTYKSLWLPFLKLRNKYIDSNITTYFCTDILNSFNFNNNIKLLNFNNKSIFSLNGNLYDRYIYYLTNIDTKYILYFYDDMFPIDYINTDKLNKLMNIMDINDDIKIIKLSLLSYPFNNGISVKYNGINFIKANNKLDDYIMNIQPLLIKRDFFIKLIQFCKLNNTLTHQNGGLEVYGTEYFRQNRNYICLRVVEDVVVIQNSMGIVQSGIITDYNKKYLKEKEDIDIETFENNLIYKLTLDEYNCLGDRLKIEYENKDIKISNT